MSACPCNIVILPVKVLKNSSRNTKYSLYTTINRGYDVPRFKYGIIVSPRVHSLETLFNDLGFDKNIERSLFYLLLNDPVLAYPNFYENFEQFRCEANEDLPLRTYYIPKFQFLAYAFDSEHVLATIGYKPNNKESYEITGFTSMGNGCDIKLFNYSVVHMMRFHKCKRLVADIIMEHDLLGYYEKKLGFVEMQRFKVLKEKNQPKLFDDQVECTKDFHVIKMIKELKSHIL
ncbi:hypothetical protein SMKI_02G0050 [Saccharomyces mikatae IFO 1815]|uniref:Uncharacterized protein n=1 Tax=Saccharomyces mikatae IFO 1815 TaxID=226126 RepID=A0AA35NFQ1_SACMI|nr:uncharacterized protein SMKI_02G0050 [Saccharomyces mikatae IFO 1815]CAI4037143.1 hypothetical protein SMKI_02G0050 [Saccharomyces mikatae IFO 1815]